MNHHSYTKDCSQDLFDVLYALVQERFPKPNQVEALLKQVDWKQGDLEAWIQNAEDRRINEALTFLLYAIPFPGATGEGPHLPEMTEQSEVDKTYAKTKSAARDPEPPTSGDESYLTEDPTKAPTKDPELRLEGETAAERLLSLMRTAKLALLEAGIVEWKHLSEDHRKLEEAYRRDYSGSPAATQDDTSGSVN